MAGASRLQTLTRSGVRPESRPTSRPILFVKLAIATQWVYIVRQQSSTVGQLIPCPRPAQRQLRCCRGHAGENRVWPHLGRLYRDAHLDQRAANVGVPPPERRAAAERLAPRLARYSKRVFSSGPITIFTNLD